MSPSKPLRPPFQSIELDPMDIRLEAMAAGKGIPTLVASGLEPPQQGEAAIAPAETLRAFKPGRGPAKEATPRSRMKGLKIELPDYVWVALKKRAAEEMVSLRHLIMTALRERGIPINEADMIEDGRRLRN